MSEFRKKHTTQTPEHLLSLPATLWHCNRDLFTKLSNPKTPVSHTSFGFDIWRGMVPPISFGFDIWRGMGTRGGGCFVDGSALAGRGLAGGAELERGIVGELLHRGCGGGVNRYTSD